MVITMNDKLDRYSSISVNMSLRVTNKVSRHTTNTHVHIRATAMAV